MCSAFEAGSYFRPIDFHIAKNLGLRVIKKRRKSKIKGPAHSGVPSPHSRSEVGTFLKSILDICGEDPAQLQSRPPQHCGICTTKPRSSKTSDFEISVCDHSWSGRMWEGPGSRPCAPHAEEGAWGRASSALHPTNPVVTL